MKKILLIVLFAIAWFSDAAAQIDKERLSKRMESWSNTLDSLDKVIANKQDTMVVLSKETNEASFLVKEKKMLMDSIAMDSIAIDSLNRLQIEVLEETVNLNSFQEFGEGCLCEFIHGRLCQPYNEKYIKEAIENYMGLKSAFLRKQYSPILPLLQGYEAYYKNFMAIVRSAQDDPLRKSKDGKKEYCDKYISEIESMPYYKRYYGTESNIPYLDQEISKAIKLFEKHKTKSSYIVDFSYLLWQKK